MITTNIYLNVLQMFHFPHSNDNESENKINIAFHQNSAPPHFVSRFAMH
jgi:hypothetical protein